MSPRNPLLIRWTESVWADVDGITDYLLAEGMAFVDVERFVQRIFAAPIHLATLPGAGKPGREPETREWRVGNTRYALVYAVRRDSLYILRVMHDSRQISES